MNNPALEPAPAEPSSPSPSLSHTDTHKHTCVPRAAVWLEKVGVKWQAVVAAAVVGARIAPLRVTRSLGCCRQARQRTPAQSTTQHGTTHVSACPSFVDRERKLRALTAHPSTTQHRRHTHSLTPAPPPCQPLPLTTRTAASPHTLPLCLTCHSTETPRRQGSASHWPQRTRGSAAHHRAHCPPPPPRSGCPGGAQTHPCSAAHTSITPSAQAQWCGVAPFARLDGTQS